MKKFKASGGFFLKRRKLILSCWIYAAFGYSTGKRPYWDIFQRYYPASAVLCGRKRENQHPSASREINFAKRKEKRYNEDIEKQKIVEYFEEGETNREYAGYFYSITEAISMVVLGSICGLRNTGRIHQCADNEKVSGFLKEKFGIERMPCCYWLLSLLKR